MGTNSTPKKRHYTGMLADHARAVGFHNGKRTGKGGKPIPHPNDKPPERMPQPK